MISVAIGTVIGMGVDDISDGFASGQYKIKLMPMLTMGISPRDLVLWFAHEEGVCNAQLMVGA